MNPLPWVWISIVSAVLTFVWLLSAVNHYVGDHIPHGRWWEFPLALTLWGAVLAFSVLVGVGIWLAVVKRLRD